MRIYPIRYLLTGNSNGINAAAGAHGRHEQFDTETIRKVSDKKRSPETRPL